jgi:hypothetical protein
MANSEPAITTNRMAVSERPNHRSASGSQQIDGSDCSPVTNVPMLSESKRERARPRPSVRPPSSETP